jgi:putative transposase
MSKGKKEKTPSFICEIPLRTTPIIEKSIEATFEASRQLYNACLGEGKRRLSLLRDSKDYQKGRSLKKADPNRQKFFKQAKDKYQFSEYSLHAYAGEVKNSWIGEHIGINLAQKLATRAYEAVEKVLYRKAKRVRFKKKNQIDSIEEKTNKTGIMWKGTSLKFQNHLIPAIIDPNDSVIAYGLSKRVKYCRLVRRRVRSQTLYSVQIVCEGTPLSLRERKSLKIKSGKVKLPENNGSIGIDLGPSTVAIVGEKNASLHQFCEELKDKHQELRRLQRKLDRQRRANNPKNYEKDGRVKTGPKKWVSSSYQRRTQTQAAECNRTSATHRKSLHGKLINENIALDSEIHLEKLSYRSFQKNFGKSVGNRAPGMFIERLKRKAENACGSVIEFSTFQTRLSQTCICGKREKKPLSQRMHRCSCGVEAQRDLFSAYLARFVQDDRLDVSAAKESWTGAETLLRTAFEWKCQTASRRTCPSSFGVSKEVLERSGSSAEEGTEFRLRKPNDETWNGVKPGLTPGMRVQESQMEFPFRTPRL